MAIPNFQSVMLPLIKVLGDGLERTMREVTNLLADSVHLIEQEMEELLRSGQQSIFSNRVAWAGQWIDPLLIEKLRADHTVSGFDCGKEELNRFLSSLTDALHLYLLLRDLKRPAQHSNALNFPGVTDTKRRPAIVLSSDAYPSRVYRAFCGCSLIARRARRRLTSAGQFRCNAVAVARPVAVRPSMWRESALQAK